MALQSVKTAGGGGLFWTCHCILHQKALCCNSLEWLMSSKWLSKLLITLSQRSNHVSFTAYLLTKTLPMAYPYQTKLRMSFSDGIISDWGKQLQLHISRDISHWSPSVHTKRKGEKLWGQVITRSFYWPHWAVCGKMKLCPTLGGTAELGAARIASSEWDVR